MSCPAATAGMEAATNAASSAVRSIAVIVSLLGRQQNLSLTFHSETVNSMGRLGIEPRTY